MAKPKKRDWFKVRFSIGDALKELPDNEAGIICKAIWQFAETGIEPDELPQTLRQLWNVFRAELVHDNFSRKGGWIE